MLHQDIYKIPFKDLIYLLEPRRHLLAKIGHIKFHMNVICTLQNWIWNWLDWICIEFSFDSCVIMRGLKFKILCRNFYNLWKKIYLFKTTSKVNLSKLVSKDHQKNCCSLKIIITYLLFIFQGNFFSQSSQKNMWQKWLTILIVEIMFDSIFCKTLNGNIKINPKLDF